MCLIIVDMETSDEVLWHTGQLCFFDGFEVLQEDEQQSDIIHYNSKKIYVDN